MQTLIRLRGLQFNTYDSPSETPSLSPALLVSLSPFDPVLSFALFLPSPSCMRSLLLWAVGLLCTFSLELTHVFERCLRWFAISIHTTCSTRRAKVVCDGIPVPSVITGPADSVPLVTQELLASRTQTHVDYQDNRDKLNSKFQVRWNEWMKDGGLSTPSFYRKVEVLLVTWDENWTDMDTKKEVYCCISGWMFRS